MAAIPPELNASGCGMTAHRMPKIANQNTGKIMPQHKQQLHASWRTHSHAVQPLPNAWPVDSGIASQIGTNQSSRANGAPPVYRPAPISAHCQRVAQVSAPPVYHPSMQAGVTQAKLAAGAPPVYRPGNAPAQPQSAPRVLPPSIYNPSRQAGPIQAKPTNGARAIAFENRVDGDNRSST